MLIAVGKTWLRKGKASADAHTKDTAWFHLCDFLTCLSAILNISIAQSTPTTGAKSTIEVNPIPVPTPTSTIRHFSR